MYLLDTNTCIDIVKRKPPQVQERFREHPVADVKMSAITFCELEYGAWNTQEPQKNRHPIQTLLDEGVEVLDFVPGIGPVYGRIRADLRRKGTPIGSLDFLIAAHALFLDYTLVTNNVREFSRVPGLRVENWVPPRM